MIRVLKILSEEASKTKETFNEIEDKEYMHISKNVRTSYPKIKYLDGEEVLKDGQDNHSVKFSIYDILGREIAIIMCEETNHISSGIEKHLRERNDQFPPGVYFYKLDSKNGVMLTDSLKLIVIK